MYFPLSSVSYHLSTILPHFIWYIIIGIVVLSILVYFLQEKFIFKPEKLKQDFQFKYDIPFRELFFDVEPGVRINGLHFYREQPLGLILYFHGNTRSIKGWARYAKDFYRYNYDVVLVDYRGFGKSTGKRSEKEMLDDMQFVYSALAKQYHDHHMIAYGRVLEVDLRQKSLPKICPGTLFWILLITIFKKSWNVSFPFFRFIMFYVII